MRDIGINQTQLSNRAKNCLKRNNIFLLSQLTNLTEEDMYMFKNMGKKTVNEILDLQAEINSLDDAVIFEKEESDSAIDNQEYGPELIIHIAFPTLRGKNVENMTFEDKNGLYRFDTKIEDLNFSVRLSNCLLRSGFTYISEVVNIEYEKVVDFKNIGKKSLNELIAYLRNHTQFVITDADTVSEKSNIMEYIINCITSEEKDFNVKKFYPYLSSSTYETLKNYESTNFIKGILEENQKNVIVKRILNSKNVINYIEQEILFLFRENGTTFELPEIRKYVPEIFVENETLDIALNNLIENQVIEKIENVYRRVLLTNEEWIETLKNSQKTAIQLRLQGKTLEECGQIMGVTRERIRQIVNKAMSRKVQTREDDYKYWYIKYLLDFEAMNYIFGINHSTYNYLKLAYKSGKKDVIEIENDEKTNSAIYNNLKKYINRNSVLIGNQYVPCKREMICRELAKENYSKNDATYLEFYEMYMSFLEKNKLDDEKLLFPSERAFEARVSDSQYVLMKYGKRFRYYPIVEYDIEEFVNRIGLSQFKNVEISTLKLFNENKSIMDEYNILDEYELHNLLKKTEEEWNRQNKYNVIITRMPLLSFGNVDRKRQTIDFLYQIAPVTLEEFCDLYELEYGVLSRTVMANMFQHISNFYNNNMLVTNQPLLNATEKRVLEKILRKDFYFLEDIKEIFVEYFGEERLPHLNPRTIKELGFRLYANYVISDTYSTADSYFTHIFTKDEILDMDQYDSRLRYVQAANQALDTLRTSFELIEYEDRKYIRYNHFINVMKNISKRELLKYIDNVIEGTKESEFFTIESLQKEGFKSELHELGLPIWFNAALLKNSKKIKFVRVGGGILFSNQENRFTTMDFIRYILKEKKKINVDRLSEFIKETYGIMISRDKIIVLINNSEMYYDSVMKKVYLSKDYYYDEI